MIRRLLALMSFLAAITTAGCAGRHPVPSSPEPLTTLKPGQRIRVLAPPAERREGDVSAVDPAAPALTVHFEPGVVEAEAAVQAVDFSSIQSVWEHRRRVWSGVGWGAAGGAVLGGLFGVGIGGLEDVDTASAVAVFSLVGAGAGAVVGAIVGSAISGWTHVYEAEPDGRGWRSLPAANAVAPGAPVPAPAAEPGGADRLRGRSGWLTARTGGWLSTWEGYSDLSGSVTHGGILVGGSLLADFDWLRVGPEALYGFLGDQNVFSYGGLFEIPLLRPGGETYLLAGAGGQQWIQNEPSRETLDYGAFAINGGAGMRFPIGMRTALGGEFRVHYAAFENDLDTPWLFTLALTFGYGL
jgi:hypothetical protein